MRASIKKHFNEVLSHLYVNPLERCNLRCKICYTRKTNPILSQDQILGFIRKYEAERKLETITFCGGEVLTLSYFPGLVNRLTSVETIQDRAPAATILDRQLKGKFVQIITNGTIDRLEEFTTPNMVNLIVSLDGLRNYHDSNRGKGNFDKSISFLQKARDLGFHTEIFSIVTRQNINQIDEFEKYINSVLWGSRNHRHQAGSSLRRDKFGMTENKISVTYHPRKPPSYLLHHPISNIFGEVDGFDFLAEDEMVKIMRERKTFPPKELGCYQIALVSDGRVFSCCEGTIPIGKMNDDINYLFDKLKERIIMWEKMNTIKNCLGCSQPDFVCGIKRYVSAI